MSQIPLLVENLSKSYRGKIALSEVQFELAAGEITGLLGANGAGKSTLLKCILNLLEIDEGRINIFDRSHLDHRARRNLVYLAEHFRPPDFATGFDVLRLMSGLNGHRLDREFIENECRALALDPSLLTAPCQSYSKGTVQKLGLISCLISAQQLMILDEPMSGLDPLARRLFKDRLLQQKKAGASVFFSTHLLEDVTDLCDRVIVLHNGRLRFCGTVAAMLSEYGAGSLEAAFLAAIGSKN